ncbi:glycosyltransferase family 4 protein [Rhodopila sp.]|uniref:glycosyltransferase family 4 protein n=1 Tax=Rhodopila sp. TaxID=2480087 RepID=UPI003D1430BF
MRRRILFVKLGHFSQINDHISHQINRNFPDHQLTVVDVKDYARRDVFAAAYNLCAETATFGPSVLRNRGDLHAYFFRTPFMFRRLNRILSRDVARIVPEIDFVIQTQGLFSARLPGKPLLIYTDYTFLDNLDSSDHDKRLFRSPRFLAYEAALYRSAEAVATTGSHVEQTLVTRYGCDPSRVTTIHVGANASTAPVATDLGRYAAKKVVFVGVEWERKGGPALIEGFLQASRKHQDASLSIIGCSPAVSHPRITVIGRIPPEDVAQHYAAGSVFCMPSLIEPLGIAAVEASLSGLPVIATKIGGFYESVTHGETGFLVPPNDPAAVGAALERLFDAPDLGRRMGLAGCERNRARFDWNQVGKRLRSIAEVIAPEIREPSGDPMPFPRSG